MEVSLSVSSTTKYFTCVPSARAVPCPSLIVNAILPFSTGLSALAVTVKSFPGAAAVAANAVIGSRDITIHRAKTRDKNFFLMSWFPPYMIV